MALTTPSQRRRVSGSADAPANPFPIGSLSKRTGLPVKTLRFYADEELVPPVGRAPSGYRLFDETSVRRVELIRTLRDAGLGLDRIRAVLQRESTLSDVLRLQLTAVEAHIRALGHVARALRMTLASGPSERNLRRLSMVTRISLEERQRLVQRFYDQVATGVGIDETWKQAMIEASVPPLPDDPSPEQVDAWVAMAEILSDPGFLEAMQAQARETWKPGFDAAAYKRAADRMVAESHGLAPESEAARDVVQRCIEGFAAAMGRTADHAFRAELRARFEAQDPRAMRYWELVTILRGGPKPDDQTAQWRWFIAASRHHFP